MVCDRFVSHNFHADGVHRLEEKFIQATKHVSSADDGLTTVCLTEVLGMFHAGTVP